MQIEWRRKTINLLVKWMWASVDYPINCIIHLWRMQAYMYFWVKLSYVVHIDYSVLWTKSLLAWVPLGRLQYFQRCSWCFELIKSK